MKRCTKCDIDKAESEFYPRQLKRGRSLRPWCKDCEKEDVTIRRQDEPWRYRQQVRDAVRRHRARKAHEMREGGKR